MEGICGAKCNVGDKGSAVDEQIGAKERKGSGESFLVWLSEPCSGLLQFPNFYAPFPNWGCDAP